MNISLSGYRTYIIAAAALLTGLSEVLFYAGSLPDGTSLIDAGFQFLQENKNATTLIALGGGLLFQRKGMKNTEAKLSQEIDDMKHIVRLQQKHIALNLLEQLKERYPNESSVRSNPKVS